MKYIIIILLLVSCGVSTKRESVIVGNKYKLCGYSIDENDPFEVKPISYVVVVEQRNGYVQYRWDGGYGYPTEVLFSRSYDDFFKMVNRCK